MQGSENSGTHLGTSVRNAIQQYFATLDGTDARNIYDLVISQIEKPLLETIMQLANNNQSKATKWLGISRNTLRKLLQKYNLDNN